MRLRTGLVVGLICRYECRRGGVAVVQAQCCTVIDLILTGSQERERKKSDEVGKGRYCLNSLCNAANHSQAGPYSNFQPLPHTVIACNKEVTSLDALTYSILLY